MSGSNDDNKPVAAAASTTFDDATIAAVLQAIEQLTSVFGFDAQVAQQAVEAVGPDVTLAYNYILDNTEEKDQGGPVVPIMDCPHVQHHVKITPPQLPSPLDAKCRVSVSSDGSAKMDVDKDGTCPSEENWVCLQCGVVRCSRYVNGHGVAHYQETLEQDPGEDNAGHCIAASLADLSVWCHACNGYLRHDDLDPLVKKLEELKFVNEDEEETSASSSSSSSGIGRGVPLGMFQEANEEELVYPFGSTPTSLDDVARFIQSDNCQSIVVLAGAGMSVASGIPDFRSAGGLYDTMQPELLTATTVEREAIRADPTVALEQGLFLQNPLPCLEVKRPFILGTHQEQWKATIAHRFVEMLHAKTGKLTRLYTQNIDGLEGQCHDLPREKVVAVHGSMDRAECATCGSTFDFGEFCEAVRCNIKDITGQDASAPKESTPIRCKVCGHNTVKPAIVLFRSKLPREFFEVVPQDLPKIDLLIVIGTSLAVAPANTLVFRVPPTTLRVVVNDKPVGWRLGVDYSPYAKRDYFAQGDCDSICLDLMEKLGWLDDLKPHLNDLPEESAGLAAKKISQALNAE